MSNNHASITDLYFAWMVNKIRKNPYGNGSYKKLLSFLNSVEFKYSIPMDSNREMDAINMRYRFGSESNVGDYEIASEIDIYPVSILEMMVALSIRCEEDFMDSPDSENRTSIWFWEMINSLGFINMTDSNFDIHKAEKIIERFSRNDYLPNGKGGLFTIEDCPHDLRNVEIWYQMHYYFEKYYM